MMKRLVLTILLVASLASGATQTKNTIPAAGSSFLSDLQNFLREEDAERFADYFVGTVVSGGTHGTVAGLTGTPSAMTAYPGGFLVTESGSITYSDDSTCWVIAHKLETGNLTTFTRVSGTNYLTDCASSAKPSLPSDSIWLMEVTTASGAITAVTDLRTMVPYAGTYLLSELPAVGKRGRLAFVRDINDLFLDNGTEWVPVSGKIVITPLAYGAKGDVREEATGATISALSTTLTCPACAFEPDVAGQTILVKGAGSGGAIHATTIASRTSASVVEITVAAVTTVSGVRVQWGTDDTTDVQQAIDAAEASLVTFDLAGRTYLISTLINYDDATKLGNIRVVNGTLLRKAGANISLFQVSRSNWAIFDPGVTLDHNSRMEHSGTTMRQPALTIHNAVHFLFRGEIKQATGYCILGYQQGDGTNQDTKTFTVEYAYLNNCWEGGVGIFNTGNETTYRINHNRIDVSTVHPNSAALPLQGPNGVIFEVENLPVATQTIELAEVFDNWIKVGGTLASNATGINHSNSTATLNIRHTRIVKNIIIPSDAELQVGISWENPCESDTTAEGSCRVEVEGNLVRGRGSANLIDVISGTPTNLKNLLSFKDNIGMTGLGSQASAPFKVQGDWEGATLSDNKIIRDPDTTYDSNYTDGFELTGSINLLKLGNTWDASNLGSEVRFTDAKSYFIPLGQAISIKRTAAAAGSYVEIGKLYAVSASPSPCFSVAVSADHVSKLWNLCLSSAMADGFFVAPPISSTGAVGGDDFDLDVAGSQAADATTYLRVRTVSGTISEALSITIIPLTVRNASGSPSKIQFIPTSATAAATHPTTVFAGRPGKHTYKVPVARTQCIAAAVTCDITILVLPAKTYLDFVIADVVTQFACTAVCTSSTLSATLGTSAGGTQLLASFDIDAAAAQFGDADAELGATLNAAARAADGALFPGVLLSWSATTTVTLRITSGTGNLGDGATTNLSAGLINIYLTVEVMP